MWCLKHLTILWSCLLSPSCAHTLNHFMCRQTSSESQCTSEWLLLQQQLKLFLRLNHLQVTLCSSTCGKTSASVHQFLTGTCIINRLLCVLVCTLHGLLHTLSQGPLTECSTNEETEPQSVGNMTELWLDIIDPYEILRSHPVFVPFYLLPHCASGRFSKHGTGYGKDVTRMLTAMECAVRRVCIGNQGSLDQIYWPQTPIISIILKWWWHKELSIYKSIHLDQGIKYWVSS